jgi:hypothetical protein
MWKMTFCVTRAIGRKCRKGNRGTFRIHSFRREKKKKRKVADPRGPWGQNEVNPAKTSQLSTLEISTGFPQAIST